VREEKEWVERRGWEFAESELASSSRVEEYRRWLQGNEGDRAWVVQVVERIQLDELARGSKVEDLRRAYWIEELQYGEAASRRGVGRDQALCRGKIAVVQLVRSSSSSVLAVPLLVAF